MLPPVQVCQVYHASQDQASAPQPTFTLPSAALTWHGLWRATRPEGTRSGPRQTAEDTTDGGISPSAEGAGGDRPATPAERPLVHVPDLVNLQTLL